MNNKGFTLIELIVTIALLAVISVISFVSINGVIEQNKYSDCENLISNIKSAAKEYVSDNRYDNNFVNNVDKSTMNVELSVTNLINENYLSDNIINPFDNEQDVTANIKILVVLNNNYTANNVKVYFDDDLTIDTNELIELNCSNEW